MHLDLQTMLALYKMRQEVRQSGDEDLLCDSEAEICPECGGTMFEDENEPCALRCPDCDAVPQ
jgi:hypothetical protein